MRARSQADGVASARALATPSRLALAALVLALVVGLAELSLRGVGFAYSPPPPIVVWNPERDAHLGREGTLFTRHPRALWTLQPGAHLQRPSLRLEGPLEHVNPAGFRGPELTREGRPGVLRIATLGDSSTFGFGLPWEDTWSARLVRELERRGRPAEVLCAGVVGYTIVQGIERYLSDVRAYRPELVIAAFGAVNEHYPDPYTDREKLALLARGDGKAFTWARAHLRLVHGTAFLHERWLRASRGKAPERSRVPVESFRAELALLRAAVEADGARLVLLAPPRSRPSEEERPILREYSACLWQFAEESGVPTFDAHGLLREWPGGESEVLLDYYHPDQRGHALIAAALAPWLLARLPPP